MRELCVFPVRDVAVGVERVLEPGHAQYCPEVSRGLWAWPCKRDGDDCRVRFTRECKAVLSEQHTLKRKQEVIDEGKLRRTSKIGKLGSRKQPLV